MEPKSYQKEKDSLPPSVLNKSPTSLTDGAAGFLNLEPVSRIVSSLVFSFLFHQSQSLAVARITESSLKSLLPPPDPVLNLT